jgi:hypothetical protein
LQLGILREQVATLAGALPRPRARAGLGARDQGAGRAVGPDCRRRCCQEGLVRKNVAVTLSMETVFEEDIDVFFG